MRLLLSHILAAGALVALAHAPASAKTAKACNAEYVEKKADLKAAGTRKADFMTSCLAQADQAEEVWPGGASNQYQYEYLSEHRVCPPGTHSQTSAVSANGYWCVIN